MIPPGQKQILIFQITSRGEGACNVIHHSLLIYHPLILIIRPVLFHSVQLIWIILIIYISKFREYSSDIFARIILLYCFSQFASFNIPLQMSSSVEFSVTKKKERKFHQISKHWIEFFRKQIHPPRFRPVVKWNFN